MSADSLKKVTMAKGTGGKVVTPQPVSERTLMESVAGLINEVGLAPQPYTINEEKENKVLWTKIENHYYDLKNGADVQGDGSQQQSSLLITLGYKYGVQMWAVPPSGEAQEILSWKRPGTQFVCLLATPNDLEKDESRASRPVVAICESSGASSAAHHLNFVSLRSAEILRTFKFIQPICDVLANYAAVVVSFVDKILIYDPFKFEVRVTLNSAEVTVQNPVASPMCLGASWLGFADRKVYPSLQSAGGVESAGTPSYTATVLYAAKSLTKGLKGLSETVASSFGGHRVSVTAQSGSEGTTEPGVVTIVNLSELKGGEFSLMEASCANGGGQSPTIAHFVAHLQHPVLAMSFDQSGLLLVTADKGGHDFHVFRIHPHPLGSSMGSVHHLYVLHRGDTGAKVQDISFAPDSRWVAVSTMRGTTHIFPITPYGGAISVRTHASHRVVNRLSRFHRTAGLDDTPTSGRNSPVMSTFSPCSSNSSGAKSFDLSHLGSPYPNPRLPPFPHPVIVSPLAQLRQSCVNMTSSPRSSPPTCKSKGLLPNKERIFVNSVFEMPRGWLVNSPPVLSSCDKRKKSPIDALFVLTSHGNLVEYALEPLSHSGTPKEKLSDDTQVELSVHATAQWNFSKPSFAKDLQPPLQPNNIVLVTNSFACSHSNYSSGNPYETCGEGDGDDGSDEHWLSQVEIATHSGPHRRLWMGPQFTFKVFNANAQSKGQGGGMGMVDVETVEVSVNRPAKSNPVNMPVSSSLLPEVIAGSCGSSLELSPRLVDPYCDSESSSVTNESLIKENLAEAMMENCSVSPRDISKVVCQNIGSCDNLSASSFDSTSQLSIDVPLPPTFCIDLGDLQK